MNETSKPPAVRYAAALEEDLYQEEDDGLGYYSDGEKRTLTDEQIAIFRHSELQGYLKRIAAGELEVNLPIDQPQAPVEVSQSKTEDEVNMDTDMSQSMVMSDESLLVDPQPAQTVDSSRATSVQSAQQGQVQKSRTKRNSRRWQKLKQRHRAIQAERIEEQVMGTRHDPTEFVDEEQGDERTFRRQARELDDELLAQPQVVVDYGE